MYTLVSFIHCANTFFRAYAVNAISEKILMQLKNEVFEKLVNHDLEFFENNKSGEL